MSKKRAREPVDVDATLVEIYEDLAHEDEDVRLKAAHSLLTKHLANGDSDLTRSILTRLFRGLCSSRKAARPGFSTALTASLEQIKTEQKSKSDVNLSLFEIINILEKHTTPDSNTSGQDERDHYFGRLFGSKAIIKSGILFTETNLDQWKRLLDIVCGIAVKKPWLRQECGWILYDCIQSSLKDAKRQNAAVMILEKFNEHKMIRTPEGLAIWIEVRRRHPKASLPKNVWRRDDPLSKKDLQMLANVLKDAKASSKDSTDYEAQGSATWAANLHFVWNIVLEELFLGPERERDDQAVQIKDFWQAAVDEALFDPSSSPERKHWGFLVLQKALSLAPPELTKPLFSKNAFNCFLQSMKSTDRFLQRSAQLVVQALRNCIKDRPAAAHMYLVQLIEATGLVDFDALTKTKTFDGLLSACTNEALLEFAAALEPMMQQPVSFDDSDVLQRRKVISNYGTKIISCQTNQALKNNNDFGNSDASYAVLSAWLPLCHELGDSDSKTKEFFLSKLQLASEQILKVERQGPMLVLRVLLNIASQERPNWIQGTERNFEMIFDTAQKRYIALYESVKRDSHVYHTANGAETNPKPGASETSNHDSIQLDEALALLYGVLLLEVISGDAEALDILSELLSDDGDNLSSERGEKVSSGHGTSRNIDGIVEILLSFASRPSKFLRRITLIIFEMFAPQITRVGLRSLLDVLKTKETKAGQQELFEASGDIDNLVEDSDVEVVSVSGSDTEQSSSASESESGAGEDSSSASDTSSDASDEESHANKESLLALEASLANALGTRKLTQADIDDNDPSTSSDSDADMTDSEMIALDNQLAEVFRNREKEANKNKKKEQKNARETVTKFKNRVLDMLEVYVRTEHLNSRSLDVIMPLLELARTTNTKQLADRAIGILQTYCKRCSGLSNVPTLSSSPPSKHQPTVNGTSKTKTTNPTQPSSLPEEIPEHSPSSALSILHQIHTEVSLQGTSNAHRSACSQTSILVCKTLVRSSLMDVKELVQVYADTRTRMLTDDTCRVHEGFFVDWGNWCGSVRGKISLLSSSSSAPSSSDSVDAIRSKSKPKSTSKPKATAMAKSKSKSKSKSK